MPQVHLSFFRHLGVLWVIGLSFRIGFSTVVSHRPLSARSLGQRCKFSSSLPFDGGPKAEPVGFPTRSVVFGGPYSRYLEDLLLLAWMATKVYSRLLLSTTLPISFERSSSS